MIGTMRKKKGWAMQKGTLARTDKHNAPANALLFAAFALFIILMLGSLYWSGSTITGQTAAVPEESSGSDHANRVIFMLLLTVLFFGTLVFWKKMKEKKK